RGRRAALRRDAADPVRPAPRPPGVRVPGRLGGRHLPGPLVRGPAEERAALRARAGGPGRRPDLRRRRRRRPVRHHRPARPARLTVRCRWVQADLREAAFLVVDFAAGRLAAVVLAVVPLVAVAFAAAGAFAVLLAAFFAGALAGLLLAVLAGGLLAFLAG